LYQPMPLATKWRENLKGPLRIQGFKHFEKVKISPSTINSYSMSLWHHKLIHSLVCVCVCVCFFPILHKFQDFFFTCKVGSWLLFDIRLLVQLWLLPLMTQFIMQSLETTSGSKYFW
jgi:hypothetical protein